MVLRHLPIQGHSGTVELLGGFSHIPMRRKERGQQLIAFIREICGLLESPVERLRKIHERDPPRRQIHENSFQ
jgi:predicted nucleotidyltransferase